jgi:hypothetical protein
LAISEQNRKGALRDIELQTEEKIAAISASGLTAEFQKTAAIEARISGLKRELAITTEIAERSKLQVDLKKAQGELGEDLYHRYRHPEVYAQEDREKQQRGQFDEYRRFVEQAYAGNRYRDRPTTGQPSGSGLMTGPLERDIINAYREKGRDQQGVAAPDKQGGGQGATNEGFRQALDAVMAKYWGQ